jgi:hypothetical protein
MTKCVSVDHISSIWQFQFNIIRPSSATVGNFEGTDRYTKRIVLWLRSTYVITDYFPVF